MRVLKRWLARELPLSIVQPQLLLGALLLGEGFRASPEPLPPRCLNAVAAGHAKGLLGGGERGDGLA